MSHYRPDSRDSYSSYISGKPKKGDDSEQSTKTSAQDGLGRRVTSKPSSLAARHETWYDRHETRQYSHQYHNKLAEKEGTLSNLVFHDDRYSAAMSHRSDDEDIRTKGANGILKAAFLASGTRIRFESSTGDGGRGWPHPEKAGGSRSKEQKRRRDEIQKAAVASLISGAIEALRVSKKQGDWTEQKAKYMCSAATAVASVETDQQTEDSEPSLALSILGGLIGNRMINNSEKSMDKDMIGQSSLRSRSRSRSRNRAGADGASGLVARSPTGPGMPSRRVIRRGGTSDSSDEHVGYYTARPRREKRYDKYDYGGRYNRRRSSGSTSGIGRLRG